MKDIIIVYPNKDMAFRLRSFIDSEGYHVSHVCALGSSALSIARSKDEGVVITASMLKDMSAGMLAEHMPPDFDIISLSRNGKAEYMGNLITLALPVDRQELLQTVGILAASKSSFTRRREDESEIISNAKIVLMNTQDLTELQAHRYLQKESMRTGIKIADLARRIVGGIT